MKRKLISLLIVASLFYYDLKAADWFSYSADISNFQVIPFDVQTKLQGATISAARSVELCITPDATTLYVLNRNVTNTRSGTCFLRYL